MTNGRRDGDGVWHLTCAQGWLQSYAYTWSLRCTWFGGRYRTVICPMSYFCLLPECLCSRSWLPTFRLRWILAEDDAKHLASFIFSCCSEHIDPRISTTLCRALGRQRNRVTDTQHQKRKGPTLGTHSTALHMHLSCKYDLCSANIPNNDSSNPHANVHP
jgi:hypothetical protein